jgi:methylmalonyl-CoA mutase cobalamin-binding subunit
MRRAVVQNVVTSAAEPVARKVPLMLPPAATVREVGRNVRWLEAGWQRHEKWMRRVRPKLQQLGNDVNAPGMASALKQARKRAIERHNGAVIRSGRSLEKFSDGPLVRAASRDLGRTARVLDGPVKVVREAAELVYHFLPFRPVFDRVSFLERLGSAYELVKNDPNSVRRWVCDLGQKLPKF